MEAKKGANPVYVSPGHNISVQSSLEIVRKCMRLPHKMPEPLHLAHKFANRVKKKNKE